MSKPLTYLEFLREWQKKIPHAPKSIDRMKEYYQCLKELIFEEVSTNGELYLEGIGTIKSYMNHQTMGYNVYTQKKMTVAPRRCLRMKFTPRFKQYVRDYDCNSPKKEIGRTLKPKVEIEKTDVEKQRDLREVLALKRKTGADIDEALMMTGVNRKYNKSKYRNPNDLQTEVEDDT